MNITVTGIGNNRLQTYILSVLLADDVPETLALLLRDTDGVELPLLLNDFEAVVLILALNLHIALK